jgi:hypothetical protein
MATTATINFSNEKKTGNFKYAEGAYVINGSSSADLANGALTNASGSIMKGEEFVGNFYANKAADGGMKVNISEVDASLLATLSPIVSACLAKITEHYA